MYHRKPTRPYRARQGTGTVTKTSTPEGLNLMDIDGFMQMDVEKLKSAWEQLIDLAKNNIPTSEMTEQQLRIVDFFTRREVQDGASLRQLSSYHFTTLNYYGLDEHSSAAYFNRFISILEDKEVIFNNRSFNSDARAYTESLNSIFEEHYKPLRAFREQGTFYRLYRKTKANPVILNPVTEYAKSDKPFFALEAEYIPSTTSRMPQFLIQSIYARGNYQSGDRFVITDTQQVIENDMFFPPYTENVGNWVAQLHILGMLHMWSHSPTLTAPAWVKAALAWAPEDKELHRLLRDRGLELGQHNRGDELIMPSDNSKSQAISVALNLLQYEFDLGR